MKKRTIRGPSTKTASSESTDDPMLSAMSKTELLNVLKRISTHLEDKYGTSKEEQQKILFEKIFENEVPVEIFSYSLSPSEALIKFLKENSKFTYHQIAVETNRDERGIWGGYRRASEKMQKKFAITSPEQSVPISIFKNRELSILENLVMFLKESRKLKLVQVAKLLNKKSTTISTAYSRAKEKRDTKLKKMKGGEKWV